MKQPGIQATAGRMMIAVAVIAIYFAGYRALSYRDIRSESTRYCQQVCACYEYAPLVCEYVFAPANWLDRAIRPNYWAVPACVY